MNKAVVTPKGVVMKYKFPDKPYHIKIERLHGRAWKYFITVTYNKGELDSAYSDFIGMGRFHAWVIIRAHKEKMKSNQIVRDYFRD